MAIKHNLYTGVTEQYTLSPEEVTARENVIQTIKNHDTVRKLANYKSKYFANFKDLKNEADLGISDPITQEEIDWYKVVKDLVVEGDEIILPEVPERIK